MDAVTIGAIAAIFSFIVGTFGIVANTFQVADSIENRRKKSRGASREVQNHELVQESLNQTYTNRTKEEKASSEPSRFDPPPGWEENINKSFADAKLNFKRQSVLTYRDCQKILIVDDEKEYIQLFRELLEDEGYEVLSAEDAESAFKILEQEIPHLIISDVMMPGVNGYAFTRSIRQNPDLNWIPIILASAYRCKSIDRVTGLEAGAIAYINKPFSTMELKAQIKASLKQTEILMNRSNTNE